MNDVEINFIEDEDKSSKIEKIPYYKKKLNIILIHTLLIGIIVFIIIYLSIFKKLDKINLEEIDKSKVKLSEFK